jgi:hypothetical protein
LCYHTYNLDQSAHLRRHRLQKGTVEIDKPNAQEPRVFFTFWRVNSTLVMHFTTATWECHPNQKAQDHIIDVGGPIDNRRRAISASCLQLGSFLSQQPVPQYVCREHQPKISLGIQMVGSVVCHKIEALRNWCYQIRESVFGCVRVR